ncbi:MAG: hypothetical protein ACKV0T_16150 [Planctomycetales bacterium]
MWGSPVRLLLAVLFALPFGTAWGADPPKTPIKLTVMGLAPRARSQAPQTIEVSLDNKMTRVVEGVVELKVYVGRRVVMDYRSEPLVLATDPQKLRLTLPPIIVHNERTPVTVLGRFVTPRETFELNEQDVVVPAYWKRWFVVGISRPEERIGAGNRNGNRLSLEMALALERFNTAPQDRQDWITYPTNLVPAKFPTSAVAYAGFDLLLLEGEGLTQLRDPQLAAISLWVQAGGSVLVRPTGTLRPSILAFLNQLSPEGLDSLPYLLDAEGRLDVQSVPEVNRRHCGLGRAVIVSRPTGPEEDYASPEWLETVLFLWKVRRDQAEAIRREGAWHNEFSKVESSRTSVYPQAQNFAPYEEPLEGKLRNLLMPDRVQGVPFWVVAAILSLFLLAIAPGDYFLLGAFRARRFTWFTLTAVSLAFTLGTIAIADRIMGTTSYQRGLVFVDLREDNRPARTSRFDVHFTATQAVLESEYHDTLYVAIDDRIPRSSAYPIQPGYYTSPLSQEEEEAPPAGLLGDLPIYVGAVPGRYAVRQQTRQWSPYVTRQTTFSEAVDLPTLDWQKLDPRTWSLAEEGKQRVREVFAQAGVPARVLLLHGEQMLDLTPVVQATDPPDATEPLPDGRLIGPTAASGDALLDLVRQACLRPSRGLFAVLSQVGPTGADSLEDLTLLDPSDDDVWLLVVVLERDEERWVVRKLFRKVP